MELWGIRWYTLWLRTLPAVMRREMAPELVQAFREGQREHRLRAGAVGLLGFWL